jgi:methyl-galactoside transport system permease protein
MEKEKISKTPSKVVEEDKFIFDSGDRQSKLNDLRKNGEIKVRDIREQISIIKSDKTINKIIKKQQITSLKKDLAVAQEVKKQNKEEVKKLVKETKVALKEQFDPFYANLKAKISSQKAEEKQVHSDKLKDIAETYERNKQGFEEEMAEVEKKFAEDSTKINDLKTKNPENEGYAKDLLDLNAKHKDDVDDVKTKLNNIKRANKSSVYEANAAHKKFLATAKDTIHNTYLADVACKTEINGGTLTIDEKFTSGMVNYGFNFSVKDFFLKNGLYFVMIIAFLICGIAAPIMGRGNLLGMNNIFEILNQASPRIFLALGVAGLILLAGTDLSIGRMVGMCSVVTCMILYPRANILTIFGMSFDFSSWPTVVRILSALLLSIVLCTMFSALAGFFTAKFKMHPFISTLSTQLLIFGLAAIVTDSKNTGVIDISIKNMISGYWGNIPKLVIFAIIGVIVVWFIWNKTKFGKNMYAVGGNPEAASVSGISVFWVTMGVFILAGILYGIGGFLESVRLGTGKFDTGTGYESDAIAACVVGGISFSGGIGKVKGAVIGAIIFTALTYALTFLGINPYYQFVIRGIIILVAVTIDSMKYLKKK